MRDRFTLHQGDCREVLRSLPDASVDAIVTDPPYGIRFMGQAWDGRDIEDEVQRRRDWQSHDPTSSPAGAHKSIAAEAGKYSRELSANRAFQEWTESWATEALRVLKPGGHLLCFASTRTYHRMASGLEDAGFDIRDQLGWTFGSGFPKSHNGEWGGTALKPAWEPIAMARKPLVGTVEANWLAYGTGALNIDACRVMVEGEERPANTGRGGIPARHAIDTPREAGEVAQPHPGGRWPANLLHDGSPEVVALFPAEAGAQSAVTVRNADKFRATYGAFTGNVDEAGSTFHGDTGSAARFFYCAKASAEDREEGLNGFVERATARGTGAQKAVERGQDYKAETGGGFNSIITRANHHPTVKPTDLMRWLVRLVTPKGGLVLDPFMGSGSTGKAAMLEGFDFLGIDLDPEYLAIARGRIDHALRQGHQPTLLAGLE